MNEAQYLLINRASVRALGEIVGIDEDELVGRFRPNFVVDGLAPFAEDACDFVEIGSLKFKVYYKNALFNFISIYDLKVVGLCTRCQMICIDQATGQKDTALLAALRDSRQGRTVRLLLSFIVIICIISADFWCLFELFVCRRCLTLGCGWQPRKSVERSRFAAAVIFQFVLFEL